VSPRPDSAFLLKIITPKLVLVEADVDEVQIPSTEGYIGVLRGHRPLVVALGRGALSYSQDGETESFEVEGGTAEIQPDRVLVFTRAVEG